PHTLSLPDALPICGTHVALIVDDQDARFSAGGKLGRYCFGAFGHRRESLEPSHLGAVAFFTAAGATGTRRPGRSRPAGRGRRGPPRCAAPRRGPARFRSAWW